MIASNERSSDKMKTQNQFEKLTSSQKGQMFIIGAVVIITALVLIRTAIDVNEILEKKKFLEAGVERMEFENIRKELPKAASNSINDTQSIANATNGFVSFAEERLIGRTVEFDGITISSLYVNLTASQAEDINVTVYNFFDESVSQVVLNLSTDFGSPVTLSDIAADEVRETSFTVNLASTQDLTLWTYYTTPTGDIVNNITINAEIDATKFIPYFDIRMAGERGELRDRFIETIEIE